MPMAQMDDVYLLASSKTLQYWSTFLSKQQVRNESVLMLQKAALEVETR